LVNGINGSTTKRRSNFETPIAKASKAHVMSSPSEIKALNMHNVTNGGQYAAPIPCLTLTGY